DEYSKGKICQQSPQAGEVITPGTTIYLTVSLGPQSVNVPDIIGISYNDAVVKLDEMGIVHRKEYVDQTRDYVSGMVADLSIDEGDSIMINDEVLIVYVANDKPLATPTPKPTPTPEPTPEPENPGESEDSPEE
ncbi:MAG: PASTA domain-containing protein, partial [Oscillospiraceae bacterium]|nr:PASTA domain-containing protein [Oscillospiraceae bacterium]